MSTLTEAAAGAATAAARHPLVAAAPLASAPPASVTLALVTPMATEGAATAARTERTPELLSGGVALRFRASTETGTGLGVGDRGEQARLVLLLLQWTPVAAAEARTTAAARGKRLLALPALLPRAPVPPRPQSAATIAPTLVEATWPPAPW